jgi:glucosamine--fructose-6-phosphate aminotransferase (isomerizing)
MTEPQTQTHMHREIREIPEAVRRLLSAGDDSARSAAAALIGIDPRLMTTIARGSSDHAAAYLKYAIELTSGIPVSSTAPSVSSVYGARLKLEGAATIAISQSGKSPDILSMASAAKECGAYVIALTNTPGSPLAIASDHTIDIAAGPELSVAATKTFVSSIVAGLMLLDHWQGDQGLLDALQGLPGALAEALVCDWTPLADAICERTDAQGSLYVLGRGPSLAIAQECALKFKETCQIHAEAYSAAEIMHGPVSIAGRGFPVLALAARDAAEQGVVAVADHLTGRGVDVFATSGMNTAAHRLPFAAGSHPLTDPLILAVSFYVFIEQLARRLGRNPDAPPHLLKVTETL